MTAATRSVFPSTLIHFKFDLLWQLQYGEKKRILLGLSIMEPFSLSVNSLGCERAFKMQISSVLFVICNFTVLNSIRTKYMIFIL